jgi:hypothetical protein
MTTLLDRFPSQDRPTSGLLLAENWIFNAADYDALRELLEVHQEVSLCETPLTVLRRISLAHAHRSSVTVHLDVAVTLTNASDALDLLFAFASSFERPIPVERVRNTAQSSEIGDFGLTWSWSDEVEAEVVAFVRHNVLVMLQGHHVEDRLLPAALQIDRRLRKLKTAAAYAEERDGFFSEVRQTAGAVPTVPTRGRLELGSAIVPTERHFFLTNKGSVNRAPETPAAAWYYRAGTLPGQHEILLLRLGSGILPVMERLSIEVQ